MDGAVTIPEVMTLDEAASYLRSRPEVVERLANEGLLPGRLVQDDWRFLRAALEEWLRGSFPEKPHPAAPGVVVHAPESDASGRGRPDVLLKQYGLFAGDQALDEMLRKVYSERGRSEQEADDTAASP